MERDILERLDSYPYRHRVGEVMSSPLVTVSPGTSLAAAATTMRDRRVSSVIVLDEQPGIVTERDILRQVAEMGPEALDSPVAAFMSAPVASVLDEAYLYVAIGRMDRLGLRHLLVVDAQNRPVGVITARALLKQRAGAALALGDEIAEAASGDDLRAIQDRRLALAKGLLEEGVEALDIAGVISGSLRDISARATEIASQAMAEEGKGEAPGPWAYLVLGSGGRGESLLAADQDNAIVYEAPEEADPWFEELGTRCSDLLDKAGVPYCKGGVMAMKPAWRHSLAQWKKTVEGWVGSAEGEALLSVDIFYDFIAVAGDRRLAKDLRGFAMKAASRSSALPRMMSAELDNAGTPFGLFGGLRSEGGRLDLKLHGLYPIVGGARAMALRHGVAEVSTLGRLAALAEKQVLNAEDTGSLSEAYRRLLAIILEQQVIDMSSGGQPSTKVELNRLTSFRRRQLKDDLRRVGNVPETVRDVVAHL